MDQGGPGREKGTGAHCRELMFIRWDLVCRVDSRVACREYIDQGVRPGLVASLLEAIRTSRSR